MAELQPKKLKILSKLWMWALTSGKGYLRELIVSGMYQSFCYGYSIGKIEGKSETEY